MIKKTEATFERITGATCDCCGNDIPFMNKYNGLDDHLTIGGRHNGKILEAVVCIKCMEEKLSFINIQRRDNTIGYC